MVKGLEQFHKAIINRLKILGHLTLGGIRKSEWHRDSRAEYHLIAEETIRLNNDGTTWVKFPNMVGNLLNGFEITDGKLVKIDYPGVFVVNGVSDLHVSKACDIRYGLGLNGTVIEHETTPHTFVNPVQVANISITALASLSVGDEIEIYVLGDGVSNDIDLTTHKLDVTIIEV